MPSTKSVHNQRNENDSLCLASFTVFSHFDIEGMLDSVFFLTGDLSSKLLMKGSILAQRESRTSAGRSSLPGRSPAGSFRGCPIVQGSLGHSQLLFKIFQNITCLGTVHKCDDSHIYSLLKQIPNLMGHISLYIPPISSLHIQQCCITTPSSLNIYEIFDLHLPFLFLLVVVLPPLWC